jgi:hypothetical protein
LLTALLLTLLAGKESKMGRDQVMPQLSGRRAKEVQNHPDYLPQQSGNTAWAHKITLGVGSTSFFTTCTAIASHYLIAQSVEVGSSGSFVGSAIAGIIAQVWPGSGFNISFANGAAQMIPVTAHIQFSYQS